MITNTKNTDSGFRWLAIATIALYAGWMLFLLRNKGYFFPLLTHDYIMGDVVKHGLGMAYDQYATGSLVVTLVKAFRLFSLVIMGASLGLCMAALAGIRFKFAKLAKGVLFTGAMVISLLLAVQIIDNRNYLLIPEYALMIATPFMLWRIINNRQALFLNSFMVKLVILFTFCTHGLFAIGYPFKTPAPFIDMIIHTTGVKEATARQMLVVAGVLDFIFSFCILFTKRGNRLQQISLCYLAAWGLLTALGRVLGNYYADLGWYNLRQFLPELLIRLQHCMVPLMLLTAGYYLVKKKRQQPIVNNDTTASMQPVAP